MREDVNVVIVPPSRLRRAGAVVMVRPGMGRRQLLRRGLRGAVLALQPHDAHC